MVFGKLQPLNRRLFFILLAMISLAVMANYHSVIQRTVKRKADPTWKLDADKFSDGDLIFRKGRDLVSRLVLSQGNSAQFSHVGVIVKNKGIVSVVHSLPEDAVSVPGVQIEPLRKFASFDNASDIAVYRLKEMDARVRKKITAYILHQVGKPFDASFLLSTDDSIYCTELAVKAFMHAGVEFSDLELIDVMLIDEPVITPDHLRQSERLERIKL